MSREITKQAENKVCIIGKLIEATFINAINSRRKNTVI